MRVSRHRSAASALCAAALLVLACSGTAISATGSHVSLGGTWSGRYSGAFSGTFTLRWRKVGSKLRGSIVLSAPSGRYSVSGTVHGTAITFGAVGAGATYTGSVSRTSMSGRYRTPQGGGAWSAPKTG
jgi:hypothetical protein